MHPDSIRAVLQFVQTAWLELPYGLQPPQVWVSLYSAVPTGSQGLPQDSSISLERAWFLDALRFEERNPNEYSRFAAAQLDVPYWQGAHHSHPSNDLFKLGRHEYGLVRFAPYAQRQDECLLELLWGGLHGSGNHIRVSQTQVEIIKELWRS